MNPSTLRTNLKTLLDANSTFSTAGAKVFKYPPGEQAVRSVSAPVVVIGEIENVTIEDGAILASGVSDRTYTVTGGVKTFATGESDAAWTTAETTAYNLIEAIRTVCIANQTLTGIATQARLVAWNLQAVADNSMEAEWTIAVRVVG